MGTSFPTALDTFTNPTGTDELDDATVPHATQHADVNDAVEAIEAKLGVGASTPSTTGHVLTVTAAGETGYQAPAAPAHSSLTGVTADQHHARSHNHSNASDNTALAPLSVSTRRLVLPNLSPPTITADQNDYAPSTGTDYSFWGLTSDAARNITGIISPTGGNGTLLMLYNYGSFDITLKHENASSSATNRLQLAGAADLVIPANGRGGVTLIYAGGRWHPMGL